MPYILNKTNGTIVATVNDASVDNTTDLIFVGKNYSGYGEVQNENFLKLLENFSNVTPPEKPIEGQVWFDSIKNKLNSYDGSNWKSVANIEINSSLPTNKIFSEGDLWYNPDTAQLHAYNGTQFVLIGPLTGDDIVSGWRGSREFSQLEGTTSPKKNIKAVVGDKQDVIAIVSAESYSILEGSLSFPVFSLQDTVKKGITLIGSGSSGNSEANDTFFWGSASHALKANTATNTEKLIFINTSTDNFYSLAFVSTLTNSSLPFVSDSLIFNPSSQILRTGFFDGIATSAYYADLAEKYEADSVYDEGTVLIIGGEKEVTVTHTRADTAVIGPVSKNPAYMMNKDAGPNETHPYIALRGRVMCKVIGPVKKGSLLVSSAYPGYAEVFRSNDSPNAVIGKALENFDGPKGLIEIIV